MSDAPDRLTPSLPAPPPPFSVGQLTPDETTFAALAQILQTSTWWIGPLIIFFIKRESKFVSFHAMQALLWQITYTVFFVCGMILWSVVIFALVVPKGDKLPNNQFPWPIFVPIILMYFGMFVAIALNLALSILYGIKAGRGQWADYPLLGRLARRILGMGAQPQGMPAFDPPHPQG